MSQNKSTKYMKSKKPTKNSAPATARKQRSKLVSKSSNSGVVHTIGQTLGTAFGGPAMGKVVGNAASYLSKIMGFGTYHINNNTLLNNNQIPTFATKGDTTIISNREYLLDVVSSTAFANQSFLVNPGNATLFPWLSKIAEHYEEFKFHGLIFEFKSTSGTAVSSTNTAMGTVMMAADYDALDAPYNNKRLMENTEFCTTDAPYNSFLHPIECAPGSNVFNKTYVTKATSLSLVPGDPRLYFPCNFQVATAGMQASSTIGELWVSYQVELSKPSLENSIDSYDSYANSFAVYNGVTSIWQTMNQNLPIVVTPVVGTSSNGYLKIEFPETITRGFFHISLSGSLGGGYNASAIARSIAVDQGDVIPVYNRQGTGTIASTLTTQTTSSVTTGLNGTTGFSLSCVVQVLAQSGSVTPFLILPITQWTGTTAHYTTRISRIANLILPLSISDFNVTTSKDVVDIPVLPSIYEEYEQPPSKSEIDYNIKLEELQSMINELKGQ